MGNEIKRGNLRERVLIFSQFGKRNGCIIRNKDLVVFIYIVGLGMTKAFFFYYYFFSISCYKLLAGHAYA